MAEDERQTAGWQLWGPVRALAADRDGWKENVKALPYGMERHQT